MQSILESDPDKAHWLGGRFATYNVWRTLTPPPHDVPLAVLDRSTVCVEDFVVGTVFVGSEENPLATSASFVRYNSNHRWSYISDMTSKDTLIFLGFDTASEEKPGNPHSAFQNMNCPETAIPRISCEIRVFAYWGDEPISDRAVAQRTFHPGSL
jgi:hypothetical protein